MNRSSFALLGSIVLASASVAITTSAPSSAGISPKAEQAGENPTDEQLAQSTGSQSGQSEDVQALPLVKNAVLKDASQQTGKPISELSIVDAQKQTWSDGCLGLGGAGVSCTQATIPGWKVTVASGEKRWVYRTNISGTLVKWDEAASQAMTAQGTRQSTSRLPLRPIQLPGQSSVQATPRTGQPTVRATPRTEQPTVRATPRTEQPTVRATPRTEQPQTRINSPATFSLAIRQPSGKLSDAIARISLKSKSDNSYSQERFVGDFKYKINKRAQFVGGMNAGDRVVVRLYDLQNRLLGFSEFELLPRNTAVYLILPDSPTEPPVLRTAYGSDNNQNGSFDIGRNLKVYDYFTQISDSSSDGGSVTFLGSLNTGNPSLFQVGGLPKPTSNSVYPSSFTSGSNAVVNQQMSVFSSDMAAVLTATPGKMAQLINVSANNTSTYRVNQLIAKDQQVGNSQPASVPPSAPASVSFNDVPTNYWAKGFISALAQKEIIKGYQGRFRPNDPVTRGELAAMLSLALPKPNVRDAVNFKDVSPDEWVHSYIQEVYQRGFFELEPGNVVNPNKKVSRLDVLMALARGLNYSPTGSPQKILQFYKDASAIPKNGSNLVAAATERSLVVNYPDVKLLKPNQIATRAEVAALIYQGMVSTGQAANISSPYVVVAK